MTVNTNYTTTSHHFPNNLEPTALEWSTTITQKLQIIQSIIHQSNDVQTVINRGIHQVKKIDSGISSEKQLKNDNFNNALNNVFQFDDTDSDESDDDLFDIKTPTGHHYLTQHGEL